MPKTVGADAGRVDAVDATAGTGADAGGAARSASEVWPTAGAASGFVASLLLTGGPGVRIVMRFSDDGRTTTGASDALGAAGVSAPPFTRAAPSPAVAGPSDGEGDPFSTARHYIYDLRVLAIAARCVFANIPAKWQSLRHQDDPRWKPADTTRCRAFRTEATRAPPGGRRFC